MNVEKKIREIRRTKASDKADHILYRTYWSLMLSDILHKLGYDATERNKEILHDFHKRILDYKTIADETQEIVSTFLFEVVCFWSQRGIFVRTNANQEIGIEEKELKDIWGLL
jgi:hypothetical protein